MSAPDHRGPAPRPLGALLEPAYRAAVSRRNARFDSGRRVTDVGLPVISVGNISVGGVGKSPMVRRIVAWLREAGAHPAIAMRGYKAKSGQLSDEEAEHRLHLPDVPIAAQPNRVEGIAALRNSHPEVDCIVLDDGFQHRFVHRDLDIVLIDATRDPFADRLLPAGWLREPTASLRRADAVVLTHAEAVEAPALSALKRSVTTAHEAPPIAVTRHDWSALINESDAATAKDALRGHRTYIYCGIGNPDAFTKQVQSSGALVTGAAIARDHARIDPPTLRRVVEAARALESDRIITTAKDWVKIEPSLARLESESRPPFVWPRLDLAFDEGEQGLRAAVLAAAGH
ncbi:MAG: tetraacyldisaccharide 4'-kinase [Planctomycetota bacterium]|nr:tetraacyldisaccharide 4'-kinase [Planctomycetota bacterium]